MDLNFPKLNLPSIQLRFKDEGNKRFVFDVCRNKYVILTPEEWVRQHVVRYLIDVKNFPPSLIAAEKALRLNGNNFRFDIVAFSKSGLPLLLVECKAPEVAISQQTFDQIAVYNLSLNVPFLLVTNGLKHYSCVVDTENSKYTFLSEIPDFNEI